MRKISYMYDKSGGTNRFHECSECRNYVQPDKNYNYKTCALHPEQPMDWKPDHMACKFFSGEKTAEEVAAAEADKIAIGFRNGKIPPAAAVEMAGKIQEKVVKEMAAVKEEAWPSHQMTIDEWIEEEGI